MIEYSETFYEMLEKISKNLKLKPKENFKNKIYFACKQCGNRLQTSNDLFESTFLSGEVIDINCPSCGHDDHYEEYEQDTPIPGLNCSIETEKKLSNLEIAVNNYANNTGCIVNKEFHNDNKSEVIFKIIKKEI